nr:phage tail tape measure protein [Gammaproteobacteria bacterium]
MATNTEKIVVQVVVQGDKDLKKLEGRTKSTTKSFGKMAAGVLGAVAAFKTITGAIGNAIKTFRDFEFQMSKVKAITGANRADFIKLSKSAEDLGRTTFFTATQVAELQTNYGKLGFTTKEILQAQDATLALATATGEDLGRAATVAGAAVRGFGLDASETQRVVDVMAVSFTSSAMDLEKFQTSMTKVAPIAKSAGFSIEDTAAMMSKLTDSGIEASIAGTSMRNILLAMQDPNSKLTKSFGKTIHSYDELVPAMNKFVKEGGSMAEVMQVVEKRQAASFEQLISNTDATLGLRDAMVNSSGAASEMAGIVGDNLEGAFKRLNSAWEGLMINFTESVVGKGLQNFVDGVADLVNVVSDFVDIPMSEKLEEERIALNSMVMQLTEANIKEEDRNKLIIKIKKEYPKFLE